MMKRKLIYVFIFAVLVLVNRAQADMKPGGLFVEPGLLYELGSTTTVWPSPLTNSTGTINGFGVGAKIGFHISEVIFAGVDGRYLMPNYVDSSNNLSSSAIRYDYGLVAGAQMPVVGLRVWAGWIIGSELDPAASGSSDYKFSNGTGYRVGAGMRVAAFSVNLEYQALKYATTTVEKLGPLALGQLSNSNLTDNAWIASVTFPLQM